MNAVLAACLLAVAGPSAPAEPGGTLPLGRVDIADRQIEVRVPDRGAPVRSRAQAVDHRGAIYTFEDGNLVGRSRFGGGWRELARRMEERPNPFSGTATRWRVMAFVATRGEQAHRDGPFVRSSSTSIEGPQVAQALDALARAAAAVQVLTDGALAVEVDVQIDTELWMREVEPAEPPPPVRALLDVHGPADSAAVPYAEYLAPRVNGGAYEPEDRVYRGPYESVFVIHPFLGDPPVHFWIPGSPATALPFFRSGRAQGDAELALSILASWAAHVQMRRAERGWSVGEPGFGPRFFELDEDGRLSLLLGADAWTSPDEWPELRAGASVDSEAYEARRQRQFQASGRPWSEVADRPLAELPFVDPAAWAQVVGTPMPRRTPEQTAISRLALPNGLWIVGDAAVAPLVGERGRPELGIRAVGWTNSDRGPQIVFRADPAQVERDIDLLSGPLPDAPVARAAAPQAAVDFGAAAVRAFGNVVVSPAADPERGKVLRATFGPLARGGQVILYEDEIGVAAADRLQAVLDLRASTTDPVAIRMTFRSEEGSVSEAVHVLAESPLAEVRTFPGLLQPAWQRLVLPSVGPPGSRLIRVALDGGFVGRFDVPARATQDIFLARLSVSPGELEASLSVPPLEVVPRIDSESAADRAAYAASARDPAELRTLLGDRSDLVRINAARSLQRVAAPELVPALAELLRSIDPRVSREVVFALAHQDTPDGWAAVRRAVEVGPFDFTRSAAARALGTRKDGADAASLSALFVQRSWRTRQAAAESLGQIPGPTPAMMLMTFLQDPDPAVRLAAALSADPTLDLVGRRMLWGMVNDASDASRLAAAVALIRSGDAAFQREGYKIVRDESVAVRMASLAWMRSNPADEHRGAVLLALTDADPNVRAAALRTLAALPGPVRESEVARLANDPDWRVRQAFAALRDAKSPFVPETEPRT
ncbi:MAG: HEAT repeat domain-containing protein [Fimbriimonadaceae bacterium]